MAQLFTVPQQVALDTGGLVINGAKLFFALSGTTTLTTVYANNALSTPLSNPVVADSSGRFAAVYLPPLVAHRASLRTADATTISDGTAIYDIEIPVGTSGLNTVTTVAALTAVLKASLSDGAVYIATGYNSAGDGGGGLFRWVAASTATVDNGLVFDADEGGTGRWLRVYSGAVDVLWFGVLPNGSDQTSAIVGVFTALGASFAGVVSSPMGVKFNMNTVSAAIPDDAIFQGVTTFQTGSGYRQQVVFTADNPPDANTDTATSIISTHYAGLTLNNTRSSGTDSGDKGLSGVAWERGYFNQGSGGPRTQQQMNYTKLSVRAAEHGGEGVAGLLNLLRSYEFVGEYEEWFTGITVTNGLYILAPNSAFYLSNTNGTSSVAPTHTSGTSVVGGISYTFVSDQAFATLFCVDEARRIGTAQADTGTTHNWEQSPDDTEDFVVRYTARGASKQMFMYFSPTTAASASVNMPYMNVSESVGVRWLDSAGSRVLFGMTDTTGLNLSTWGRTTFTATNNSTTPSIAGGSRVLLSNTNPTLITDFIGYLLDQNIRVYATNGNTTLVHSGLLSLKGAVNAVLANGNMIELERDYVNSGWIEASRNF